MSMIEPASIVLLGFISPGPWELVIIGVIGVLLFGKRLPEVGRSLGKGIIEFKRGVQGIETEIDDAVHKTRQASYAATDDFDETSVPKFEPPASEPKPDSEATAST